MGTMATYRLKRQFDEAEAKRAGEMAALGLPKTQIALILWGIRDATRLTDLYGDAMEAAQAGATVCVAGKLYDLCMRGEPWAIAFWLRCRAGWSDKQTIKLEISEQPDIDALRKKVGRVIAQNVKRITKGQEPTDVESTPCDS